MTADDGETDQHETARTVGRLVKYSRELNQSDSASAVGNYALEATVHVVDGHPSPTVFELRDGDLHVLESVAVDVPSDGAVAQLAARAYRLDRTVLSPAADTRVDCRTAEMEVVPPADLDVADPSVVTLVTPSHFRYDARDTGAILAVQWSELDAVEQHHVKPVEYLTDHVATAIDNLRSRERLERARNDLATRKEMIEMYDRLLRHDLGNDLQVISGFSDVLVDVVGDEGEEAEYARKISRTAEGAADLIGRVGDLVKTLGNEREPEARDLEPILSGVIADVDAKFDSLTVDYDPTAVEYVVYAGDLIDSMFTNVVSNAAVHNDGDVTLSVFATEPSHGEVAVGFADDGDGVDPEVRDDIFEMGRKGPESDGTGIGLGLTRALVESYGGAVEVGESDRGGAEFRIVLPRH